MTEVSTPELSPEACASMDAQTLAFVRAVLGAADRLRLDIGATEGEQVEWATDQVRASIDRVHAMIETADTITVGPVDEAIAPKLNCPACGGTGKVVPPECDCVAPFRGCTHEPDVCPACGGVGRVPTPARHPDS